MGLYGDDCIKACPDNCTNKTCQILDGSCFKCKPGWKGPKCNTGSLFLTFRKKRVNFILLYLFNL